ncbi:MAG: UDP-glucose 4-epimerase GalE [Lentisphaeria bacterium]|nr:UDP-glucose 4-epimerase GalE [Lentisphaeria bacterium]NQZ69777.1 UDP-glucose 4-epimerase GalE [Lentisphaeria bacterium]
MAVLVTGGAGYIGSHTNIELLNAGYDIVVVDNLSNSNIESLNRVKELTGKDLTFYEVDLLDRDALETVFQAHKIDSVIHFAALKSVGESVSMPLKYYQNNITGTLVLCDLMEKYKVNKIVFSSSATVYGVPETVPITEDFPLSTTNPYGSTKLIMEGILQDLAVANPDLSVILLRYFNPSGAHESGRIGEDPNGIPSNLMPYITQVAVGKLDQLSIFGDDYDTVDGTGVRDYIHVVDLAIAHVKALDKLASSSGVSIYNLGTGQGYSVLELLKAFEDASGKKVPYKICPRRSGDVGECYANPAKANKELNWKATRGIKEMCEDSWRWQNENPDGF